MVIRRTEYHMLETIGLTDSEAKVYCALLELGTASAGNIASKSGTTSSKIYEVLTKLTVKGLVSHIVENGIKLFTASSPDLLINYVEEKEEQIHKEKELLKQVLPRLHELSELAQKKSEASIYRGMKGLRAAFYEAFNMLKKGDEILVMSTPSRSPQVNTFFVSCAKDLRKKNISIRSIFSVEAKGEPQTKMWVKKMKVKYTPHVAAAAVNIIGKRVIIFPKEITTPTLFVIDDENVAKSFKAEFEFSWKNLS